MTAETPQILIVDDQASARETLRALLYSEGYQLTFAANGEEALDILDEFEPDVILLDVMMPGMTGFEVCQQLKAHHQRRHIPVVLITALDSKDDLRRGLEAGADDFLHKPVNRQELRSRVHAMLRIKSHYDDLQHVLALNHKFTTIIAQHLEKLEYLHEMGLDLMSKLDTDAVLGMADSVRP